MPERRVTCIKKGKRGGRRKGKFPSLHPTGGGLIYNFKEIIDARSCKVGIQWKRRNKEGLIRWGGKKELPFKGIRKIPGAHLLIRRRTPEKRVRALTLSARRFQLLLRGEKEFSTTNLGRTEVQGGIKMNDLKNRRERGKAFLPRKMVQISLRELNQVRKKGEKKNRESSFQGLRRKKKGGKCFSPLS